MLLGLFQTADVENLIELRHHAPDFVGRKTTVLHRVDDVATAGIVAPRLGEHGRQVGIMLHVGFLLDKKYRERHAHFLGPS